LTFNEYLAGLRGKCVAVAGAGISNTPLINALLEARVETIVCDKRTKDEIGAYADKIEGLGARLRLGVEYLEGLDADVIFRTPGIMPHNPALVKAVSRGAELTSEMEAFFDVCSCKIIAVTGSDGKTTTTTLIAGILEKCGMTVHIGGNIGAPLLCKADAMRPDDCAVIELSSFQLITMKKSPDISVVTNASPNHLDVHSDFDEYVSAKRNIYIHQNESGKAIFNLDNGYTRAFAASAPGEVLFFSSREKVANGAYLSEGDIFSASGGQSERVMSSSDILLPGAHSIENYMAAIAAVSCLIEPGFVNRNAAVRDAILETARTFRGVSHRIELIRDIHGARFYNDSIASSPTRVIAGLRSFDQKVILIAGGKDKGVAFDELGEEIARRVKTLVLTGAAAEKIREAVVGAAGYNGVPEIIMRDDFTDAVLAAADSARQGDIVLLSPACTSFDRFANFEERGDKFREIINGLK